MKRLTTQDFIEKSKIKHKNKYDYSKSRYINSRNFITIICPIHGEFTQRANDHLSGYGCPYCGGTKRLTTQDFIEKSKKIHGDRYDYSKVEYVTTDTKVCIICKKHGEFWQTPHNHLKNHGCPICNLSKLEDEIAKFLDLKSIKYIRQYKPLFLKHDKWQKSLDFYLPDYNIAIECQGIQHFKQVEFLCNSKINNPSKLYNLIINNDIIKYNLCLENKIKIIYYTKERICTDNLNNIYINNIYDNVECILKYIKEYKLNNDIK